MVIGQQLENHGIEVRVQLDGELSGVRGRPYQLEQVVLNLLANARDALRRRIARYEIDLD